MNQRQLIRLVCDTCGLMGAALAGQVHGGRCPRGCGGILARASGQEQAPLALPAPESPPPAPRPSSARAASAATYRKIVKGELLPRQCLTVYSALHEVGACTGSELARRLADATGAGFGAMRHVVSRRLPDLRALGVVVELAPRLCAITGRHQTVWQTANRLPVAVPDARRVLIKQIHRAMRTADLLILNEINNMLARKPL